MTNFIGKKSNGAQGYQGHQGIDGPQGSPGSQGPQGLQGLNGINGSNGAQGSQGSQGPQGLQGAQGAQGAPGAQGAQGAQGNQGTQGTQGASVAANNWQLLYDVNFSTLSVNENQNLITGGNGSKTINNKVWTAANTASAEIMSITNGVGLQIKPLNNLTNWYLSERSAPLLTIPFSNLGTFPSTPHDIRVMIYYSYTTNSSYQYLWLGIDPTTSPTGRRRFIARGHSGTNPNGVPIFESGIESHATLNSVASSTRLATRTSTPTTENIMGAEFYGSEYSNYPNIRRMVGFVGTYLNDWPASFTHQSSLVASVSYNNVGSNSVLTSANTNLTIATAGVGAASQQTATIIRLKVEYRDATGLILG